MQGLIFEARTAFEEEIELDDVLPDDGLLLEQFVLVEEDDLVDDHVDQKDIFLFGQLVLDKLLNEVVHKHFLADRPYSL